MDEKYPYLHRDDIPMEIAEEMVARLKAEHEGFKVQFIGDMTDAQKAEHPEMMEQVQKLYEHLAKSFTEGLCHICGAKFPSEWPPGSSSSPLTQDDDDNDDWLEGWGYYDAIGNQPPTLVCPVCEEKDSDGQSRPVILPE